MMAADAYRCYLSLKNHFTKDKYDYHKYRGKVRATNAAFYKRKDRFWFEKFARQKNDKEVVDFFVSNFVYSTDHGTMVMFPAQVFHHVEPQTINKERITLAFNIMQLDNNVPNEL